MFQRNETFNSSTISTQTLAPNSYTADTDGTEVSLSGSMSWSFQVCVGAWVSGSVVIHFERRTEDGAGWEAIPGDELYGLDLGEVQRLDGTIEAPLNTYSIEDGTKDGRVDFIQYIGFPRGMRARIVATTTPSATLAVNVIEFNLRYQGRNAMLSNWNKSNVR